MGKKIKISVFVISIIIFFIFSFSLRYKVFHKYEDAIELYSNGKYQEAIDEFKLIGDYRDSYEMIKLCETALDYEKAVKLYTDGEYEQAEALFGELGDYEDSALYKAKCAVENIDENKEKIYDSAKELFDAGEYEQAAETFEQILDYKDSMELYDMCIRRRYANSVCAGIRFVLGITDAGEVKVACTDYGMTYDFSGWKDVISIAGQDEVIIGLSESGEIFTTSREGYNYACDTDDWHNIIQVTAGNGFAAGLTDDGTVKNFGRNVEGQCNTDSWSDIIQISAGHRFLVGLDKHGELFFAGAHEDEFREEYELKKDDWKDVVSIQAYGGDSNKMGHVIGLTEDNRVVCLGDIFEDSQTSVDDLTNIKFLSVGENHIIAINEDNEFIIVGNPGTLDYNSKPEKEKMENWPIQDIVAVYAGYDITVALTQNGEVFASGNDKQGQTNANEWTNILVIK